MRQRIIILAVIVAAGLQGFSQQNIPFHLKSAGKQVEETKKIELKSDKGEGVAVESAVTLKWDPKSDCFTIQFQNNVHLNQGKYLCVFPVMKKMGKFKKEDKTIWFDKPLKKQSENAVYGYCKDDKKCQEDNKIKIFDLGTEKVIDLPALKKTGEKNELTLYLYIADKQVKGKRNKRVCYQATIVLDITLEIDPCLNSSEAIKDFNKHKVKDSTLNETLKENTKKLSTLPCKQIMDATEINKKDTVKDNPFPDCEAFNAAINSLNAAIKSLNETIEEYNRQLKKEKTRYPKGCPKTKTTVTSVKTDCSFWEDKGEKLANIFIDLTNKPGDLTSLKKTYEDIKAICKNKSHEGCGEEYDAYEKICSMIDKKIKEISTHK